MLVIRDAQLEALSQHRTGLFLRTLAEHLAELFPARAAHFRSEAGAGELAEGLLFAKRSNVTRQVDVARWFEIVYRRYDRFAAGALPRPALSVLCTYGEDPGRRLDRFEQSLGQAS